MQPMPPAAPAVAVVGIGCRFPGGVSDPASFWSLLSEGRDAIAEIPASRIDLAHYFDPRPATPGRIMTRWGGFLDGIEGFDADFFGISPREAERLDPQQRLLLETAWEALEDAGQDLAGIDAARAGVFVGQWLTDFESRLFSDPEAVDFYMTTGSGRYASSGRLSYALGLRGPSLTLDTACSSSLAAVHLAARSVRSGECLLAIAGGVNIILQPHISIAYSQSRMMAPDGRCKFGDARGDGYVRSEGAGLVVLKTLAQAQADGDRIYALIRGSAVNNDGRSSGSMGTPSRSGQEELLRSAYRDAGRPASEVGYVEAHGTGTRAGDPVELGALADVLGEDRAPGQRAAVGSVKTNFGHTEGAAGVAGFIKAALVLHHREIPASLHCLEPNPAIPWAQMPVEVARQARPWPAQATLAGVSAFGIAGTNAHVVLEQAPADDTASADGTVPLLPLSARSDAALRALALRHAALLTAGAPLADVCWNAATRRTALERRAVFVADDAPAMVAALKRYADGEAAAAEGVAAAARPKIAFVCPGQGAQWTGMARELMAREPIFRAALADCDEAARPFAEGSLVEQLMLEPGAAGYRLDQIDVIQPVLVALAWAYAALWRSHGVEPDAVVGHSMGEVAAAAIAGALSLPQAMRIICRRSALMRRTSGQGAMALVELGMAEAQARIAGREQQVAVAVSNSPRSSVISGDPGVVQALMAELEREGVFCRLVKVDVASHSPQMQPLAVELAAELHDLQPAATHAALYSTVLARRADGGELAGHYWADNLRQPVRFGATVQQLLADGVTVFIELGPHPVLLPALQQTAQAGGHEVVGIACARRDEPEQAAMRAALGALHCAGFPLAWARVLPRGRTLTLPTYPWQRERHWIAAADIAPAGAQGHGPVIDGHHPVLGAGVALAGTPAGALWNLSLDPLRVPAWFAHGLHGSTVLPASAWLELSLAAAQALAPGAAVHGLRFERALHLQPDSAAALQLQAVAAHDGTLQLGFQSQAGSAWTLHAQAQVGPGASRPPDTGVLARLRAQPPLAGAGLYARLQAIGARFGEPLHAIAQAWFAPAEALAQLLPLAADRFRVPPAALDACFQLMVTLAPPGELWLPTRLDTALWLRPLSGAAWVHAKATAPQRDGEPVRVDAVLFDEQGPVLQLDGLVLERLGATAQADAADAFYAVDWVPVSLAPAHPVPREWAVIADRDGLAATLREQGERVHLLSDAQGLAEPAAASRLDVLDLRPLDLDSVGDAAALHAIVQDAQAVIRLRAGADVRLWLATRGTLAQSPLSGLAATLAAEHGDRFGGLVEIGGPVDALLDAVRADAGTCARRGDRWLQPRLRRVAPAPSPTAPWRADASCLLTGGLGGVGRHVAAWLVGQGVRHLVVLGRTPLPPRSRWAVQPTPAVDAIRALEALGADVQHAAVDVADEAALARFLAQQRAEGRPPIRSVVHAAGITDDRLLHELDAASLAAVLAPKLQGAWNLHRALPELDRFVMFSSMAAAMPQAGQASYAAANAFLDALARQRRAEGRHAQSIGWGVWTQTGVMQGEAGRRQQDELLRQGIGGFAPSQALSLLGDALRQDAPHLLVMPVDWRAMRKSLGARDLPLLRELLAEAVVVPPVDDLSTAADPAERRRALERAVRDVIGRVLKLVPAKIDARKPLGTMGLTSLMALELRNRLEPLHGKPLSATLAWNYPTLDALVGFLAGDHEAPAAGVPAAAPAVADVLAGVDELSDEDAARLLRRKR